MKNIFILLLTWAVFSAAPAHAGVKDNHGDWSAFTSGKGKSKVCYIATEPKKSVGKYKKRGTVALVVTHGPGKKMSGL